VTERGGNGKEKELESPEDARTSDETAEDPAGADREHGLEALPEPPGEESAALRDEVARLKDALLRRRADFENYKKRVERDRAAATVDAEASLLAKLLGTVDNLERALAAESTTDAAALREGVALTLRELLALLETLGVEAVSPLGQRFDPSEHQAILHEPAEGFAPGTVAEVYRKGFRFRDRLLRPAYVKVASEPGESDADENGGEVQ
jgi:molecular chaperone GrpE